jgi:uncharacterized iron-regulated membrane protein
MRQVPLILLALLALGLLGYAVNALVVAGKPRPRVAAPTPMQRDDAPAAHPPEQAATRLARALAASPEPEQASPEPDSDPAEPAALPVDRAAATAAFEQLLGQLAAYEGPRSLSQERSAELYRQLNDAFTGLSLHESDPAALEDAFARMQAEMGRLDLRRPAKRPSQE